MPSNPPPPSNPEPSRSQSFPTCPEDAGSLSPSPNWPRPTEDDRPSGAMDISEEVREEDEPSPVIISAVPPSRGASRGLGEDDPASSASRSPTLSPLPESIATNRTTPGLGTDDANQLKIPDTGDDGSDVPIDSGSRHVGGHSRIGARRADSSNHNAKRARDVGQMDGEEDVLMAPSMGSDYSSLRVIPTSPSSYLRPGSKFHGTQQSERQVYDVQVEIKQVDLRDSFLCGYLRIQGLTEDHPTLTTYFEGEIIGTKYNFFTNREGWGASNKIDLNHWKKFTAFRPLEKQARKGPVTIRDVAQKENIFMRWKEHFLVPDHRVRTITGASFEGFYYICFNQLRGEVSGIYFHSKSEKFQQLELKHVEDRGCFGAMEFR